MYIYKGKINEVRAYYEDLEKTFPNVFYIRSIEPLLDITEGKYLDAKLKSKELLSKKPRSVPLLNYYSLATFKLCELEEAMEAAKLADSILPEDSTAKAIIAAIYLEMGDLVMAEEYAVKALANWIDVDVSSYMDDPITILSKIDAIKIQ